MVDLVSMPTKIVPYLRETIQQSGGDKQANFAVYQLGRKWGKETVKISDEKSSRDELPTKAALVCVHSGLMNIEMSVDKKIEVKPYNSNIEDRYFLGGYILGIVSELLQEDYTSNIKDGYFELVKAEQKREKKLSVPEEKRETALEDVRNVEPGESYLIIEEDRDAPISFNTFMDVVEKGIPSLCFTRVFPPKIEEKFGEIDFPIFWLSTVEGDEDINTIQPQKYKENLHKIIESFLSSQEGIFMIHGLEFLNSYNEFEEVITFIQDIRDQTALNDGVFLLPIYPNALDKRELSNLKSELEELKI